MTRILHWYLARELLRVTALALVALTLLMTVFGIIQPLREYGLASDQVLALFGYMMPVMLSLTLPVAALFAGTIVYGRFSQDNELLACRASGVSTLSLLKPALALGVVVTMAALILGNFVAPGMLERAERAAKNNIARIVFPQLRKSSYIRTQENAIVHADRVDSDQQILRGVVFMDMQKVDDHLLVMASTAKVHFDSRNGQTYATIEAENPAVGRLRNPSLVQEEFMPWPFLVPNYVRERPAWYNWGKLLDTLQNPSRNEEIEQSLNEIKRRIGHDAFAQEVAKAVNGQRPYDRLRQADATLEIRAGGARVDDEDAVRLSPGKGPGGGALPVEVRVLRGGKTTTVVSADAGKIWAKWSPRTNRSYVTVELTDNVVVRDIQSKERHERLDWIRGELEIPDDITRRTEEIDLNEMYANPRSITSSLRIRRAIENLKRGDIRRLFCRIKAEMHGRISYGVSCFLLVALGSALGLIFKGGQFISAFAISLVPGTMLIVLMLMGKEFVKNPDLSEAVGLSCIWGSIVLLAAATVLVYVHLSRE